MEGSRQGRIKNPLRKRWIRELRDDKGKYIALFLFLTLTIGFVSGFLVADNSMKKAYDEAFEKYNIEDGHFSLAMPIPDDLKKDLENENIKLTEQFYQDEDISKNKTVRAFKIRKSVNKSCLMEGRMPKNEKEVVIDRLFAENSGLEIGHRIKLGYFKYNITGLVALSDYSALFRNNSDMMFNATNFSVALVTEDGFNRIGFQNIVFQYAWEEKPGKKVDYKKVEDILKDSGILTDYVRQKDNQAIMFTGDDMGGDKAMFIMLLYIVIVIMAFVFGVTTKSLIEQESTTIGALRASGFTKGELLAHYLKLPVMVVLIAAVIGNLLGYLGMKRIVVNMYFHSYSLTTYKTLWNGEAFLLTTVIPIIIILLVTFLMLVRMLSLPPLQFLRKELTRKKKKRAARLPNWSFMRRFRLRVIIQNRLGYAVLILGIMMASLLLIFGMGMKPLMDSFRADIENTQIAKYQYVLKAKAKTDVKGAEKYCVNTLNYKGKEDIMAYGIKKDSAYVEDIKLPDEEGTVLISSGFAEKYELKKGDKIKLSETYGKNEYELKVGGIYEYPPALSIFMERSMYNKVFDEKENYYNGYFSDKKLKDIDERLIASTITLKDMTLISDQLNDSFGAILPMFGGFAIVVYVLLLYLLAKMIIDKNSQNISMLKILGYTSREAGGIYSKATAIVVVCALIFTLPLSERLMRALYYFFMKDLNGWLTYYLPAWLFVVIPAIGIVCYFFIHLLLTKKVRHVGLAHALRSME